MIITLMYYSIHTSTSICPHARIMSNIVGVCLAAIHASFERRPSLTCETTNSSHASTKDEHTFVPFCLVFDIMSTFDDWRASLASLLQPLPFPDTALTHPQFIKCMKNVVQRFALDKRCDVHLCLLGN
jgi:hypothetical protein